MGVGAGFAGYAGVRGVEYAAQLASKAAGNGSYGGTSKSLRVCLEVSRVCVAVCM
jgi:hypothetical protein